MYVIAVTGITGKSGQYFLKRLIAEAENLKQYRFILLSRRPGDLPSELNAEWVEADLTNREDLEKVFSRPIDMVLHIAGIKFSLDLVEIALAHGVDHFILVHTTGIYSKYKAAGEIYRRIEKRIGELVGKYRAKNRDIAVSILRPTMIYGDLNDQNVSVFIKMTDKLRLLPVVNGARYDLQPVWCKDLGDAYFEVLTHWDKTKNKEYILSGGAPIQLRQMFKEIARQLGKKNLFVSCPYPIAYAGACLLYWLSFKRIDYREKVQRLVEPRAYSHDDATSDFGFNPVPFNEGVRDEVKMYLSKKEG